jgi:uncharacterized protein YjbI with pentapeptide repeats
MTVREWLPIVGTLLVPVVIAAGTWVITLQQSAIEDRRAKAERELAEKRTQDEVVQAYLDQMSSLLLNKKLLGSEQGDPVYTLAQARTATIITRLDASHNKRVIQFLMNSGLAWKTPDGDQSDQAFCQGHPPEESSPHLLSGADLHGADLRGAFLTCADLSGTRLYDANLSGAVLNGADLSASALTDANLSGALLYDADLSGDYLHAADLNDAYLFQADLSEAVLSSYNDYWRRVKDWDKETLDRLNAKGIVHADPKDAADLSNAYLYGANLTGIYVYGVDMSDANLQGTYIQTEDGSTQTFDNGKLVENAASLEGATMPNGQKYED